MKALGAAGFAVPEAIAQSRHTIVMGLVDGVPLRSVRRVGDPAGLYAELVEMIVRLAGVGLIHGDFNEFNIMVRDEDMDGDENEDEDEDERGQVGSGGDQRGHEGGMDPDAQVTATARVKPVVIDFPQMVSIDHANAEMYFDRDVNCIKTFFKRRFNFTSEQLGPFFADAKKSAGKPGSRRLDIEAEASGFSKKMAKELERYMQEVGAGRDGPHGEYDLGQDQDSDDGEESDRTEDVFDSANKDEASMSEKMDEGSSNVSTRGMSILSIDKG